MKEPVTYAPEFVSGAKKLLAKSALWRLEKRGTRGAWIAIRGGLIPEDADIRKRSNLRDTIHHLPAPPTYGRWEADGVFVTTTVK